MDSTLYWLWLAEALGSGCRLASRLLEEYPDPAELYGQVKAGWNPPEYLSAKAREFMQAVAPAQMAGLKKRCDDLNIFILTPDSADYPQRLRDLPDLPLALYVTGDIACLNGRRYAGMVGTRRPSTYGRQAAFDLSLAMARAGVVLVSGLADGLDSEAHRAAATARRLLDDELDHLPDMLRADGAWDYYAVPAENYFILTWMEDAEKAAAKVNSLKDEDDSQACIVDLTQEWTRAAE